MLEEKSSDKNIGGPIVSTAELDRAYRSGEAAQGARKGDKPAKKTTSADLEILSSSRKGRKIGEKGTINEWRSVVRWSAEGEIRWRHLMDFCVTELDFVSMKFWASVSTHTPQLSSCIKGGETPISIVTIIFTCHKCYVSLAVCPTLKHTTRADIKLIVT